MHIQPPPKTPSLITILLLGVISDANAICDASIVQNMVGAAVNTAVLKTAQTNSKAGEIRVVYPPHIVTKDVRFDRLTIFVEKDQVNNVDKIKNLNCF
ncbi:TPA: hypothetical protein SAN82_002226 [Pseudomonas putida]|nr:hypothetical protein [Pseudomonas putida]